MDLAKFRERYRKIKRVSNRVEVGQVKSRSSRKKAQNYKISMYLILKAQGKTVPEIAEELGICVASVYRYARKLKE